MQVDTVDIAFSLRKLLDISSIEVNLPFFYSFPKNCCEYVSVIFCLLMRDLSSEQYVTMIHGSHKEEGDHHFWVEVNGLVYDLTIDQFEEMHQPVYGSLMHPLESRFSVVHKHSPSVYETYFYTKVIEIERFRPVYLEILRKIKLDLCSQL